MSTAKNTRAKALSGKGQVEGVAGGQPQRSGESTVRKAINHTGSFLGSFVAALGRGILRWKESTIFLPLAIGLFVLICAVVILVTGRQLLNDLGDMVDFGKACVKLAIIVAMVGWIQESLIGYRTESGPLKQRKANATLADDIYDSCNTHALLLLCLLAVGYWL